ncbi:MAG: large conductance mechanosensitive channel protein MscL [Anaerolineaceae bacterium]|jgi:large conductance mechanosensitive channel|nr:large conductance mechanosensitive channel protein MscL [Anaerolineaceae bacterium]
MKKLFNEFKDFISRGNVIDLAIGIIIGSAFSTLVNSIVTNLMMPPFGLLLGNVNFQDLFVILKQGETTLPAGATLQMARDAGAVTLNYGQFITDVISFLLLALGVFLIVKVITKLKTAVEKPAAESPAEPQEKECPFCFTQIPQKATRCPNCTSQLESSRKA